MNPVHTPSYETRPTLPELLAIKKEGNPMKVSEKHISALVTHTADALGATPETARALLASLVGEGPTYEDLRAVDTAVVSAAVRGERITAPYVRHGAVAKLLAGIAPGAPTCNHCGRLPLRLEGSTWSPVDGDVCPVDEGLFVREERRVVVSWVDRSEHPGEATRDAARVPITEAEVLATRRVDPRVTAACAETGASILDVLAALADGGKSPPQALAALASPDSEWIDGAALRAFAARSRGALSRGRPKTAPSAPAPSGAAPRLRDVLAGLYDRVGSARAFARDAGIDISRVDFEGSALDRWDAILGEARKSGREQALLDLARAQYPNSPGLASLRGGAPS